MRKDEETWIITYDEKQENTAHSIDNIAISLATISTILVGFLKLNGRRISEWKYCTYLDWYDYSRVYDEVEEFNLSDEHRECVMDILKVFLSKYFRSNTKSSATQQLELTMVFMNDIREALIHNYDINAIIYGYHARYCKIK